MSWKSCSALISNTGSLNRSLVSYYYIALYPSDCSSTVVGYPGHIMVTQYDAKRDDVGCVSKAQVRRRALPLIHRETDATNFSSWFDDLEEHTRKGM